MVEEEEEVSVEVHEGADVVEDAGEDLVQDVEVASEEAEADSKHLQTFIQFSLFLYKVKSYKILADSHQFAVLRSNDVIKIW